jgi:hypothetical protein
MNLYYLYEWIHDGKIKLILNIRMVKNVKKSNADSIYINVYALVPIPNTTQTHTTHPTPTMYVTVCNVPKFQFGGSEF